MITGTAKTPRVGLSQSLSFPAKGSLASTLRKSPAIIKQTKGDANNPTNGSDVANGLLLIDLFLVFLIYLFIFVIIS